VRHRIGWYNVRTGKIGHGEWRDVGRDEVEADVVDLDESGPEVRYWFEAESE
jgi:hypothetical protein